MTDPGQPICANCGARLTGEYCAQCGQNSSEVRVSIRTLANDFLTEHVGLDKKVPTTIWRLVCHPGALTTDYLAGKRARFALILYLLYFRSRRFYAEHLIFAFHFHAFVFVALTVAALMPGDLIGQVAPLVVFVYLFLAMRQVYGENRVRTSVKCAAATTTYLVTLLFTSLVVMAGVFLAG